MGSLPTLLGTYLLLLKLFRGFAWSWKAGYLQTGVWIGKNVAALSSRSFVSGFGRINADVLWTYRNSSLTEPQNVQTDSYIMPSQITNIRTIMTLVSWGPWCVDSKLEVTFDFRCYAQPPHKLHNNFEKTFFPARNKSRFRKLTVLMTSYLESAQNLESYSMFCASMFCGE